MAMTLLGTTVACSADWGESTLRIEYSEPDRGRVTACAELSASASHRENKKGPRLIEVSQVRVDDKPGNTWAVGGVTSVIRDGSDEHYEWTCVVRFHEDSKTLMAELVSIERTRE
jgi:hypothetical protein